MKTRRNPPSDASASYLALFVSLILASVAALIGDLRDAPITNWQGTDENAQSAPIPVTLAPELSLSDRVAYQYAIEEIYWRHRVWPRSGGVGVENKPTLSSVVSSHELEDKVQRYLRKSQLVADRRGATITPRELQAEMERMASNTKQPEVLGELFAALGNDPFVIAECLAKPVLAERLTKDLDAKSDVKTKTASNDVAFENYKLPEIHSATCVTNAWTPTDFVDAPSGREGHTAVWTGSEMIIWGGGDRNNVATNTGGQYNPALDSWTNTNPANAPSIRSRHTAIWTGVEMVVWGGYGNANLDTGSRYNPITDTWVATSSVNAPLARLNHTAVWTGSEMIVWGGYGCGGNCILNTGARYNPTNDSWVPMTTSNAPVGRWSHTAIWTGNEMIVWGGTDSMQAVHTGGRYNPASDSWTPTALTDVPLGRIRHSAVWTGNEMIVWGGFTKANGLTQTGGKYNPVTDSWVPTSPAPLPRTSHTAIWTGSEMIVWGGTSQTGGSLNTGEHYNPATESWLPIGTTNAPSGRSSHTAIWTGREMIVWGGEGGSGGVLFTGGSYCAQSGPTPTASPSPASTSTPAATATPTPTATPNGTATPTPGPTASHTPTPTPTCDTWTQTSATLAPTARSGHTAIWTGSEMIVWGGYAGGSNYLNTGGRYNPSTNTWAPTSTTLAPSARSGHSAVWTGSEMIVWGGYSGGSFALDTGARYNPATDVWSTMSVVNVPTNRFSHTALWTGGEMIVWGGQGNGFAVRTGGRYFPGIPDTWSPTTITDAASPRNAHTAVWTGNEMIVWGGSDLTSDLRTGGRYNPTADSWMATSIVGAPIARHGHTTIWTGNEMVIWGGTNGSPLNTGGRFVPVTDGWIDTSMSSAPVARFGHTAVWTGSEMIVWGGTNITPLNSGGRYAAGLNRWASTSTASAPTARSGHTAVWTGSEMIVWGGFDGTNYLRTGGRYCAQSGPTPTPPPPTATPCPIRAYISNGTTAVSVIDTCNDFLAAQVPLFGSTSSGVAVNPAGTRVYLTNNGSDSVSVIDTSTNTVAAIVPVGRSPLGVAVNPDGTRAYVANHSSQPAHTVSVIDTSSNTVATVEITGLYPYGVAVKPDGTRVYVTTENFNVVSVIDASSNTEVATVTVQPGPHGVAFNPAGTRAYVANSFSDTVSVIDTSIPATVATFPVGGRPEAVAVNSTGTRVYVTNAGTNTVSVIDTSNNTAVATVPVGNGPSGVSVTPDGTRVYVANAGSDTVSVIDTSNNTVVHTIGVAMRPRAFGNFIAVVPPATPPPTPAPTPSPHPCQLRVLIVYSDDRPPADFLGEIQSQPNVVAADLFDTQLLTPTLAVLQQYDIVVPCSFSVFEDPDALGNNLADYVDGGGVVVQFGLSHTGPAFARGINGRWVSGNYNPYYYSNDQLFSDSFTLGPFIEAHPLMAGVTALKSNFANLVYPVGSTEVAKMNNNHFGSDSLIAIRQVNGGHITVGVTAYVGDYAFQSGDWGKIVVNAGNWLTNCQSGPIPTPTPTCDWRVASPMSMDVYGAAGTSDGTYFYAAGGYSWTQAQSTINVLNRWSPDPPPNGAWTTLAPMPQAVVVAMAVYYPPTNKIYVFGGLDPERDEVFDTTQIYDIASNTWSIGAPMPGPRALSAHGYVPATDRIYVIGGCSTNRITDVAPNTWAYDPVTDSWTDLTVSAPFPHPASGSACGVINNKLYIAGGADAIDGNNRTWEYDPVANAYMQKTDEPASLENNVPGSAVAGGLLWVFGGGNPFAGKGAAHSALVPVKMTDASGIAEDVRDRAAVPDTADDGRYYDPATDTWKLAPNLVVARSFPSGGAVGDSLLIAAGGYNGFTSVSTVQKAIPCVGTPPPIPSPSPSSTPPPTPTMTPSATPLTILGNISTRARVETEDNVLIAGFIVTGTQPKKVIVRAIGPSLGMSGALSDPILELRDSSGQLIRANDNWRTDQQAEIIATGIPPTNDLESAIVETVPANSSAYTAIVRGMDDGTGVGLVEVYDLDHTADSRLANISTRSLVQTGNDVMIAGTIVLGQASQRVLVRAIGPSLPVEGSLADPDLELRDANGNVIRANDNWRSDQEADIIATGIPPTNDLESAIVETLPANGAAYTAIVGGVNETTGVALVEVYGLTE